MLQPDNGCLGKRQTLLRAQPAAPVPHGKQLSGPSEQLERQQLNWAQHKDPWLALALQICCRNRELATTHGFLIEGLCLDVTQAKSCLCNGQGSKQLHLIWKLALSWISPFKSESFYGPVVSSVLGETGLAVGPPGTDPALLQTRRQILEINYPELRLPLVRHGNDNSCLISHQKGAIKSGPVSGSPSLHWKGEVNQMHNLFISKGFRSHSSLAGSGLRPLDGTVSVI